MAQRPGGTATSLTANIPSTRSPFRFRKIAFVLVTISCLVAGALSVGLSPVVTYLGECSRQKLAAHRIFLSYGEIAAEGAGITLHRVSLQLPEYQVAEQFDSVSVVVDLKKLLLFRPTLSVRVAGFGGALNAEIERSWNDSPTITSLTLDRIALRSVATLAPIGITNGVVSGSLYRYREPSSECDSLSPPCYRISVEANQIEKGQGSEVPIPKAMRDAFPLPGFPGGGAVFIPAIARTNFSAALSINSARTIIQSMGLQTTGIDLSGSGALPAGTGGASTIGWYENVQASGSLQLDKTIAGLIGVLLRPPTVQGSIAPHTPTRFTVAGPLLSPTVTLTPAERGETKTEQPVIPQSENSVSPTPGGSAALSS